MKKLRKSKLKKHVWGDVEDMKKEAEFLLYRDLARSLAGKFSRQYHKAYVDLVEVAEYALCLELFGRRGFDKKAGTKKSTWLYTVIYFHLTQVCTRGLHPCPRYEGSMQVHIREWVPETPFSCLSTDDQSSIDPEEKSNMVTELLSELSAEARALVQIVLQAPGDLANVITSRDSQRALRMTREAIRVHLIDEFDWTTEMVDRAWAEVEHAMPSQRMVEAMV